MIVRLASQEPDSPNDLYWNDLRNHDYSKSFPAVRDFVHQQSGKMRNRHNRRNRVKWISSALVVLLIFFACKRQTFTEPQGATLNFLAKDSAQSAIEYAIHQYADKTWRVKFRSQAGKINGTITASTKSYDQLKSFAESLKSINGVTEFHLTALSTGVKESPLSRLSYKIFDQHLDAKQLREDELIAQIEKKLLEGGQFSGKVVSSKEAGKTVMRIEPTDKSPDFAIDFEFTDGTKLTAVSARW